MPWATASAICRTTGTRSKAIDQLQGGFIWDWVDQGLSADVPKNHVVADQAVPSREAQVLGQIVKGGVLGPVIIADDDGLDLDRTLLVRGNGTWISPRSLLPADFQRRSSILVAI